MCFSGLTALRSLAADVVDKTFDFLMHAVVDTVDRLSSSDLFSIDVVCQSMDMDYVRPTFATHCLQAVMFKGCDQVGR